MMITKNLLLICFISVAILGCKTQQARTGGSLFSSFSAPDATNTAVVLVHGWGKTPRRPNFIWRLKIRPYTDLSTLQQRLKNSGFANVNTLEYDDELSLSEMSSSVARQIQRIFATANNPNLKLDVFGHSLGQWVALKAVLDHPVTPDSSEKISNRVRLFVGLAGAVRGQDTIRPCKIFPNQCGGAEALSPYYRGPGEGAELLRQMFQTQREAINQLKKCSVYARADEIVDSPYNAGSFTNLGLDENNIRDIEINYDGSRFHREVKENPEIISKMLSGCYGLLGSQI